MVQASWRVRPASVLYYPLALFATFVGLVFAVQIVCLLILVDVGLRMLARPYKADGPVIARVEQVGIATYRTPIRGVGAGPAGAGDVARTLPIVRDELRRYGPSVLPRAPLQTVVLCANITSGGERAGGLTLSGQGVILLDVSPRGPGGDADLRHAFHHEMSHVLDDAVPRDPAREAKWSRLNPADFAYGGVEVVRALETLGEDPRGRPDTAGFLTYYAMASAGEDRAEILAAMMVNPDVWRRVAAEDPILRAKGRMLRSALVAWDPGFAVLLP
ncbi:MAG TPA: putative zinc-binding metallopeptidase [Isosphaeraceae bacterium]